MKRLSRFRPTPALVIACIALFAALGGSAYAAVVITGKNVKNYSLTGKDIKKNGLGGVTIKESRLATVPSAEGLSHTAVVGSLGQLVRGKGVVSSVRTSTGRYQVTFNRNIQTCVAVASIGDPSAAGPPTGQISTTGLATNGNILQVRTTNQNTSVAADKAFQVIVSC
jgi:hypothetical protein